jgi:hypothetical protein
VALILLDRVKVNTTTTGTGTVVLASTAPAGYQSFAVIGDNNTTYYTIAGQTTSEWEVGIGTYYLANSSLSRTTILSSSAANAAVTFSAGTKDVFVTYPAEQAVYEDAANIVTITSLVSSNVLISGGQVNSVAHTGGSINNMTIGATTANTIAGTTLSLNNVFTSTYAGSATSGSTQVYLNGATSNRIDFNTNGAAAPAVTTRSAGTKIVYYPTLTASATDYAAGIEGGALWNSIPATANSFKWYANVTAVATLLGTGVLSTTGGFSGNGANLTALSATAITTGAINSIPVGNSTASTGAFTTLAASGDVNLDAGTLFVDSTNNRVGIGTAAPAVALDVQAASNAALVARIYNANTNSATQTQLQLNSGGKIATLATSYAGNFFSNQGTGGLVSSYVDYDNHYFRNNAGILQFAIGTTASANNYVQMYGGAGTGPIIQAVGADTNVDIKLTPKGTGYANITSGGVKLGNSTIQDSAGNLVFTTGGANTTAFTIDGNQVSTFNGTIEEKVTVSATAAAANVNFDAVTQNILFYTSNATANTTINLRGSATIPLNNAMANGQSISLVFMNTQGNTAFYVSGYQIDGVAVTPKWQGNSAPTSGNARGIDVYSLTAIKTANATYTVLASQTQFA